MTEITTSSPRETFALGKELAKKLLPGDVVALFGGLGMGKTVFVAGLAEGLGCTDEVSSPTFTIVHEYHGALTLYHFDMYRIESWDDLISTGFFDYIDSGSVLAVEWSENIENALPENAVKVVIERVSDNERLISIDGREKQ